MTRLDTAQHLPLEQVSRKNLIIRRHSDFILPFEVL